jgi:hypothetical protein
MNTYIAKLNDEATEGVYAISLVQDPAMESMFVALSKEQVQLKSVDEEKRILMGAVLIPNKAILRRSNDGEEFNIVFPEETIRMAAEKFFQRGHHQNSTIEHSEAAKIDGVTVVESWIKEDDAADKSVKYGFNEPVGTWFASMKINNDEVWNDYVKTGQVKGFSIDGFFNFEKVKLNKNDMELNIKQWIADGFAALSKSDEPQPEAVQLGSVMTVGQNPVKINFEGDMIGENTAVTMTSPDGEELPVPAGAYPTEDGKVLIIGEGSIVIGIEDVKEEIAEEAAEEAIAPAAAPAESEMGSMEERKIKSEKLTQEVIYLSKEDMAAFVAEISNQVEAKIEAKLSQFKTELSSENPVSLTKSKGQKAKSWEEMTPLERFRATK